MLGRLLNSAVALSTGVAGALADLLEVRPDEGVPHPELVEALLALVGVGSGHIHFRGRFVWCLPKAPSATPSMRCLDPLPLGDTSLQVGQGRAAEVVRQLL